MLSDKKKKAGKLCRRRGGRRRGKSSTETKGRVENRWFDLKSPFFADVIKRKMVKILGFFKYNNYSGIRSFTTFWETYFFSIGLSGKNGEMSQKDEEKGRGKEERKRRERKRRERHPKEEKGELAFR